MRVARIKHAVLNLSFREAIKQTIKIPSQNMTDLMQRDCIGGFRLDGCNHNFIAGAVCFTGRVSVVYRTAEFVPQVQTSRPKGGQRIQISLVSQRSIICWRICTTRI
jgi:hypothetical protein